MATTKVTGTEATRRRDRDATASAIVAAAEAVLADEGFAAFGINAVARRAGCDKQLIYRYFGGLDGLLEAVGEDLAVTLARDLEARLPVDRPPSYGAWIARAAVELVDLFRAHPLLRRIHAWEVAAPAGPVRALASARSRQMLAWVQAMRGDLAPPAAVDYGAINAALFAAAQHLALSGSATGAFAGMSLSTEEDWSRAKEAIGQLALAAYTAPMTT